MTARQRCPGRLPCAPGPHGEGKIKALRSALDVLKRAWRPYVVLNVAYYGLVLASMAYVATNRSLQQALRETIISAFTNAGPLASVLEAYTTGRVTLAIGMTFGVNLVLASFAFITLPSLIVPFSGLLLAGLRALVWGALFAPQIAGRLEPQALLAGLLVAILILLEGQGYVLAALGAYLHGRAFLWPRSVGLSRHGQGYWYGLKEQARVYLWVVVVLLISAIYEVSIAVVALSATG